MRTEDLARVAVSRYREQAEARWRRMPKMRVLPAAGAPAVYYLTTHGSTPQGGVRVSYRHVDVLNEIGIKAAVLHLARDVRPTWFVSTTPVVSEETIRFRENDILVVPEIFGKAMMSVRPDIRVLVFNQGGYITFDGLDYATTSKGDPYGRVERLEGIMTVSEDSAELLRMSFPGTDVKVARPVIDPRVFFPGTAERRNVVAFAPSRRASERNQILHILRSRGCSWEPLPLQGMTELQLAESLRSAPVFLSLSDRDGFGLPPAEAMACGCYVVGYSGGGGREFFDPSYCDPVESTLELVGALERVMGTPLDDLAEAGRRASAAILDRYRPEGLEADLTAIYGRLM